MVTNFILIFIVYIINVIFHEVFHYLSLLIYNQRGILSIGIGKLLFKYKDLEIRINPLISRVSIYKNKEYKNKLFFIAGILGNFFVFIISFLCKIKIFWMFSLIVFISNIILISPVSDIYKFLGLDINISNKIKNIWNGIYFLLLLTLLIISCIMLSIV